MKIKLIKFIILLIAILQNQFNFSMTIFGKGGYVQQIAEYEKSMKIAQTSLQNYVDKKNMEEFRTFQINFKKALDILNLVENSAKKDIANLTPLRAYLASKGFYPGDKPSKIYGAQAKQNAVANLTNNLHFKLEHILTDAGWLATAYYTLLNDDDSNARKIWLQIRHLKQFDKVVEKMDQEFMKNFQHLIFKELSSDLSKSKGQVSLISVFIPRYNLIGESEIDEIKDRLAKALEDKYLYPYDKSEIIFVDSNKNEIDELDLNKDFINYIIIGEQAKEKIKKARKQIIDELPDELLPELKKIVAEYII